jgi:hypothetical protein
MDRTLTTPLEIDEALAVECRKLAHLDSLAASLTNTTQWAYGKRRRGGFGAHMYETTAAQAWELVEKAAAEKDVYNVRLGGRKPSEHLTKRAALAVETAAQQERIDQLEGLYTGWSRFFVVTSSAGHVHATRACHTCRPTTTYGWRPDLSGNTEAEAVAKLGPALCSVCFPTAPVEHQANKITKARAAKLAA